MDGNFVFQMPPQSGGDGGTGCGVSTTFDHCVSNNVGWNGYQYPYPMYPVVTVTEPSDTDKAIAVANTLRASGRLQVKDIDDFLLLLDELKLAL